MLRKVHAIKRVENGELFMLLLYMVFPVILSVVGIEIKQNLKSFTPKVLQISDVNIREFSISIYISRENSIYIFFKIWKTGE